MSNDGQAVDHRASIACPLRAWQMHSRRIRDLPGILTRNAAHPGERFDFL
jgi:hypothetical protein